MDLRKTVFYDQHVALGAKLVPFAGFEMPVEYTGVRQEHLAVREKSGMFDVSHMGEVWVKGPGARDLVQKLTTNDVKRLKPGAIQYTCFTDRTGGIVDDLLVYHFDDERYLLVVNAANVEKDVAWIREHNNGSAQVEDASATISQLAVQGPRSAELLQDLTTVDLSTVGYYHFVTGEMGGEGDVIISNSGYTGAGGFELYFENQKGPRLWDLILKAGSDWGMAPAGLAARDTLRLEMGYCLYGNDIHAGTSPLEAGLGWITRFIEGNDFLGREVLEKQKSEGVQKRLVGIELIDRGIPRKGYPILGPEGENLGEVTSGTMSPMLSRGIGLGYVKSAFSQVGQPLFVEIRNKQIRAEVVKPPFYKPIG